MVSTYGVSSAIEINIATGEVEVHIFYCEPQQINQESRLMSLMKMTLQACI